MRGRKPKPTSVKALAGNPGKRALNRAEAKPRMQLPHAPAHLTAEAKKEWERVSRELYECGLMTTVDRAALAAYCQAFANWAEAERHLQEEGRVLTFESGYQQVNPWASVSNKAVEQMMKIAAEFGMTPSARSRVAARPPEREESLAEVLFAEVSHDK